MTGKATRRNVACQGQMALLFGAGMDLFPPDRGCSKATRYIKRGGKVWIKHLPDKPVTEKPETRMGSG